MEIWRKSNVSVSLADKPTFSFAMYFIIVYMHVVWGLQQYETHGNAHRNLIELRFSSSEQGQMFFSVFSLRVAHRTSFFLYLQNDENCKLYSTLGLYVTYRHA